MSRIYSVTETGRIEYGEGFVDAPKRKALGETSEHSLTKDEIAERLVKFWKGAATKHGGKVDAAWIEVFVALYPDGKLNAAESKREIVLTDQEYGKAHIQMPVRALYYSKVTGKPSIQHTEEEEILEMQPVIKALREVMSN